MSIFRDNIKKNKICEFEIDGDKIEINTLTVQEELAMKNMLLKQDAENNPFTAMLIAVISHCKFNSEKITLEKAATIKPEAIQTIFEKITSAMLELKKKEKNSKTSCKRGRKAKAG